MVQNNVPVFLKEFEQKKTKVTKVEFERFFVSIVALYSKSIRGFVSDQFLNHQSFDHPKR